MNEESREHISCLMDGEISREAGRFLVRRLGTDSELSAIWARYHLVRDCLRHQEGRLASENLSGRIRSALEAETTHARTRRALPKWFRPVAGIAVAASVALMAIVSIGPSETAVVPADSNTAEQSGAPSFVSPRGLISPPMSQQASFSGTSAEDARMNAYLLRHYQATGTTGGKGFVSFVPIVITQVAAPVASAEPAEDDSDTTTGNDSPQR